MSQHYSAELNTAGNSMALSFSDVAGAKAMRAILQIPRTESAIARNDLPCSSLRSLQRLRRACTTALLIGVAMSKGTFAAAQPAPLDKEAYRAQVAARETRADLLLNEIRGTDDRIEATVDKILETLRLVGDSKDSRTKVARMKEQTIDGLQKNITFYQQKRAQLQEEMRRPSLHLTPEEKQRAIAKFDSRIEKRVQQVLVLTKSLPGHKDYERYTATDGGWWGPTYVQNENYKQNKRLTTHTNTQRAEIAKELQRSIDKIDSQIRTLHSQFVATSNEAHRKMLMDEIGKYEALKKSRVQQFAEASSGMESATRPVSGKEAQDLDASLRKVVESLRRDFTALFQRYSAYLIERSNVNAAKSALASAK
jgi:hypothetical protein